MTIYWGRPIPGWVIFSFLVLVLLCANVYPPGTRPIPPYESQIITGIPYESPLSDSLPHYQYKKIEDSLNRLKMQEDYFSSASDGSENGFGYLGIASYESEGKKDKFFTIEGYSLDDFTSVENKKTGTQLLYPVWDKVSGGERSGHLESKQTTVKYQNGKESGVGKVYLPISNGVGSFLKILFFILMAIAAIISFYALLYIPIRFLFQLAKGSAFTEENIGHLYLTGWCLVGFSIIAGLLPVIAHLLSRAYIPAEIQFSYYAALLKPWKILVTGLAVLLLAKAFLQGLQLKEEQALTI